MQKNSFTFAFVKCRQKRTLIDDEETNCSSDRSRKKFGKNHASALIDIGCSVTASTFDCVPPLHLAARSNNHADILQRILNTGVDVDYIYDGKTPLRYAVDASATKSIRVLLENGAEMYNLDYHFWKNAISRISCISEFCEAGFDVNRRLPLLKKNLLHLVAEHGNENCVLQVLNAGANVDSTDDCGFTALDIAVKRYFFGHLIVKDLLVAGADTTCIHPTVKIWIDSFNTFYDIYDYQYHCATLLWLAAAGFNIEKFPDTQLDVSLYPELRFSTALVEKERSKLALLVFQKNKRRAADICFALQVLDLPALVTLSIVDVVCDPCSHVPMHKKWNLVTAVKHFSKKQKTL
jgi:hypothetical protein